MSNVPVVSPELPTRTWRLVLRALGRLPQGAMSRSFGRVADLPIPRPARRMVVGAFARAVGVDLSEAEHPPEHYGSLGEFFVRRLRPGARTWPQDDRVVCSPVDGVVGQHGRVERGRLVQAKGRWYSAAELLQEPALAARFEGGSFLTIYLSPRHYHRIHSPCDGVISEARHVPGALLPVNAAAVAHIPDLFSRNERLMCHIEGRAGLTAVVAVGAYNVGRISAAFDSAWSGNVAGWVTNRAAPPPAVRHYDPALPVRRGDEIMAFHLGSTVVLLFEPGRVELAQGLRPGQEVRVGEGIGAAAGA